MKKFLLFSLVGLITLAIAGMVYAQPKFEFKASGRFDTELTMGKNNPPNAAAAPSAIPGAPPNYGVPRAGGLNKSNEWLSSRGTLIFDAKMGNEVSGTVIFEIDAFRWGANQPGTINNISERQTSGFWGADRSAVEVKNVYMDFGIPGVPVPTTMRVGVQPLAIRPTFFLYTDGPGVVAGMKIDPLTISPVWFRAVEGQDFNADDADVYGIQLRANIDKLTVGGYWIWYDMNTYPFFGTSNTPAGYNAVVLGTQRASFWWLGAYLDGKLGPVAVNFDFVYNNGEVERRGAPIVGADNEVDYSGWRTRVKIDFPWEKMNVGFIGGYGTGADARKTSASGLPGTAVANGVGFTRKVKTSVVPPGSEQTVMFGESLIFYSSPVAKYTGWVANLNNNAVGAGSLGGTWFAKLYGTMKVAPDFKVTLQGLYVGDTTRHGNTVGNAVKPNGTARNDGDIGWEFDLITELQVYKNLTWQAGAGYMFFGDAMDMRLAGTNTNRSPNNAWTIQSRIMYVF